MKTKSKRKTLSAPTEPTGPQFPVVFETFNGYITSSMQRFDDKQPSCFNGYVNVRKYRVTIEIVPEPDEVIRERIIKLWRMCDNHHHWTPLKSAAAKVGLKLDHAVNGIDNPNHYNYKNRDKTPPPTQ